MSALAPPTLDRPASETAVADVPAPNAPRPVRRSRRRWRVPARVWVRRVHLWATLSVGLLLLAVSTSGAAIVLRPELDRVLHADLYRATPSETPASIDAVVGAVRAAHPDNPIGNLNLPRRGESYEVELTDPQRRVYVDPGTGAIRGERDASAGVLGWLERFHTVLLAEETMIPLVGWHLSTTLLGISALALLLMVVTGAVLWWPGVRRFFAVGFGVRLRRNAYAANHDLHKVLGFVALLPLLILALTGVNFEFSEEVRPLWYALAPGGAPPEPPESASQPGSGPAIGADEAGRLALAAVPGARVRAVIPPADGTGYHDVWLARGIDPAEYGDYPGLIEVRIDPYTGDVLHVAGAEFPTPTNRIYEQWAYSVHTGLFAPWYVRLAWVLFGLAPLALAVTGVAMWWLKRRGKRRPARARSALPIAAPSSAD